MRKENLKSQRQAIEMEYKPKPRLSISSEHHPDIKNWKVGEKYEMPVAHVVMKSARHRDDGHVEGEFEIESFKKAEKEDKGNGKKERAG